jgi:hypothetical protein
MLHTMMNHSSSFLHSINHLFELQSLSQIHMWLSFCLCEFPSIVDFLMNHLSYSPLLLIRRGTSQFQFYFFFCYEPIWLAHCSKKMKLWRLPQIEGSNLMYRVPPLWPTYIRWKEDNICQSTPYKSEVLWRTCCTTHWELDENLKGT